jgi:hypothetical protein
MNLHSNVTYNVAIVGDNGGTRTHSSDQCGNGWKQNIRSHPNNNKYIVFFNSVIIYINIITIHNNYESCNNHIAFVIKYTTPTTEGIEIVWSIESEQCQKQTVTCGLLQSINVDWKLLVITNKRTNDLQQPNWCIFGTSIRLAVPALFKSESVKISTALKVVYMSVPPTYSGWWQWSGKIMVTVSIKWHDYDFDLTAKFYSTSRQS